MRSTAQSLGVEILEFPIRGPQDFDEVLHEMAARNIDAVAINEDPIVLSNSKALVAAVASRGLPAIGFIEFAEAGGLMAYGVNIVELHRRAAVFVDKILKGAKPGDLPVERPTKFNFIVNLKAAKVLNIAIPPAMLARADELIE
jgi:putative ABC transport system substrate-binding protein